MSELVFEGAIAGLSKGGTLIGWAHCVSDAERLVWVEIQGDGEVLDLVCANVMLDTTDGSVPFRTKEHGFVVHLGNHRLEGIGRIDAYIANTTTRLSGTLFPHGEIKPDLGMVGHVENHGGLKLWGWAWNPAAPEEPIRLHVYRQGELLAEIVADRLRQNLLEQGLEHAFHGFEYTLPLHLADGRVHTLDILTETGTALPGSPLRVFMPEYGLPAWLDSRAQNPDDQALLGCLAERYQRHVPLSVDFSCYPAWLARFGRPCAVQASLTPFLIVIQGDGDLSRTLQSLRVQTHPYWCAYVQAECAMRIADPDDDRIKTLPPKQWEKCLQQHQARKNSLISFVVAGDTLASDALAVVADAFTDTDLHCVYSDCDVMQANGEMMPWFKPEWDPDLFLHEPLLHHLFVTRSQYISSGEGGGARYYPDCQAWPWLALAAIGGTAKAIRHLPWVLYHKHTETQDPGFAHYRDTWLKQTQPGAEVQQNQGKTHILWSAPEIWPKVSLIIPTRDRLELLKPCLDSLMGSDYPDLELVVVDNDSAEPKAVRYLKSLSKKGIQVLAYPGSFNFSAMNNRAVETAQGAIIGLINNDVEALDSGWLKEMVRTLLRPDVGAVGAKLLWPNGMVQHGGVLLGLHGLAGHIGNNWHADDPGYFGLNQALRRVSAVTAACLLCRREDYLVVGGLDETNFPVNFNDVDFCLRLRAQGKHIVWTPHAVLRHAESASRGRDETPSRQARQVREKTGLLQRWANVIAADPCYNPNLNLDQYSHAGLALPPRYRNRSPVGEVD